MNDLEIEGYALSVEQRRAWTLGAAGAPSWVRATLALEQPLAPERLTQAIARVAERYEILRTRFVRLPGMSLPLQAIDRVARAPQLLHLDTLAWQPPRFDPDEPAAVHCVLASEAARHTLTLSVPGVFADPFTLEDLLAEIGLAYDGAGETGETLQYADYASWQAEFLAADDSRAARAYWQLGRAAQPQAAELPFQRPTTTHGTGRVSAVFPWRIPRSAARATFAHAAFQALLWRLVRGAEAGPLTTFRSCDGRGHAALRGALGAFARTLPVTLQLPDDYTGHDLLGLLKQREQEHQQHALGYDPEARTSWSGPAWGFAFHPFRAARFGSRSAQLLQLEASDEACELQLRVLDQGDTLAVQLELEPARFDTDTATGLLASYGALLDALSAQPQAALSALPLLHDAARRERIARAFGPERPLETRSVIAQFSAAARATPNRPALICGDDVLTFAQTLQRAERVAGRLCALGVGAEDVVGLCLPRGVDSIACLLGIWRAGAAYIPLDPELPPARLAFLLQDTRARALVTQRALADHFGDFRGPILELEGLLTAAEPAPAPPERAPRPEHLAYVLYTSGSSGRPKGCMIQHASLSQLSAALDHALYAALGGPGLQVGLNASLAFDASVKQLIQVCRGHTLHVLPDAIRHDASALTAYLQRRPLDVLDLTPTQLRLLWQSGELQPAVLPTLLLGGEPLDAPLWETLASLPRDAFNLYGPTECTVDSTIARVSGALAQPVLGLPLANVRVHVLDPQLEPVPVGVPGELYIGGVGVARGYLAAPVLTAERFVPDPFAREPGARLYRTGDRARVAADGTLSFLGRNDQQIKLRGVRIELAEIELTLQMHPAVAQAAVAVHGEGSDARLVGYAVAERAHASTIDGHRRYPLPNGLAIAHQNKNETDYLYRELFQQRVYVQHGVVLPRGGVILDVGANIGMFTLFARMHSPEARIYAFEPLPPLYETLAINGALYGQGRVTLFPFGLSEREQTAAFTYYGRYSMMSGRADYADPSGEVEVIKTFLHNQQSQGDAAAGALLEHADALLEGRFLEERHEVSLRRLSDILRELRIERVELLKIDVQRAELDVLAGLDDEHWPRIAQLVLEVHDSVSGPTAGRLAQLTQLLQARGFTVVCEQDPLLAGTDRHNVYAFRNDQPVVAAEPAQALDPRTLAAPLESAALRDFLAERLPAYMVPAQIVPIEAMPLTESGKLNRAALPAPEQSAESGSPNYVEPQSELERQIAGLWAEVLRVERVGVHDNFFDLGGHSMLVVQVHNRLKRSGHAALCTIDLFRHPTIAALTRFIAGDAPPSTAVATEVDGAARKQSRALSKQRKRMKVKRQDT